MTYTPEQMRDEADRHTETETYFGIQLRPAHSVYERAMLRQGADAVAENAKLKERVKVLEDALRWYEKQSTDCLKITSDGEVARNLLDRDGGARARIALETKP